MSPDEDNAVTADVDRYRLAESGLLADVGSVPAGTNIIVLGSSITGADDCLWDVLEYGLTDGQPGIVVTTSGIPADRTDSGLFVVDCSGTAQGGPVDASRTQHIGSPSDLTGIGIGWVKCARAIGREAAGGLRVGLLSISTLLQYVDSDRVFNFLHVLTGRISAAGYLGVFVLDPDSHDDEIVNQIKGQFQGVVTLDETEEGVAAELTGLASRR
jgi:hypothetical protein